MAKLIDLAKKNLKKTEDERALETLKETVEDNEMAFANELHAAKKTVKAAQKKVIVLASDPFATANIIIAANREVLLAVKNVEDIQEIMSKRF
tara:strand:- start:14341 stop:14619 length:279 start_codon:yes stop_codon:yes gene_type:complete